nr:hypothetical protein [Duganella flavida]
MTSISLRICSVRAGVSVVKSSSVSAELARVVVLTVAAASALIQSSPAPR